MNKILVLFRSNLKLLPKVVDYMSSISNSLIPIFAALFAFFAVIMIVIQVAIDIKKYLCQ